MEGNLTYTQNFVVDICWKLYEKNINFVFRSVEIEYIKEYVSYEIIIPLFPKKNGEYTSIVINTYDEYTFDVFVNWIDPEILTEESDVIKFENVLIEDDTNRIWLTKKDVMHPLMSDKVINKIKQLMEKGGP